MIYKNFILIFLVSLFSSFIYCQEWESVSSFSDDILIHHAIGFSFNEKGYIVTGSDTTVASKKFFMYDSYTDTWTQKEDFPGEQRSYAIGDFYEGKQYIGFGVNFESTTNDSFLNDLWSYDPVNDSWEELAECPCSGRMHPSFNALDGKIYVGLGNVNTGDTDDFWAYDIETNSWSQKADFIGGERHHPYHFTLGESVYVGLGHNHQMHDVKKDWFRYDAQSDTWTQLDDLPAEGRVAGTQLHHEGYGYALSGQGEDLTGGFHHPMESGEFWKYDPQTDTWEELTPHPGKSRFAPASFIIDDYAYIISGLFLGDEQSHVMRVKLEDVSINTEEIVALDFKVFPSPASNYINISIGNRLVSASNNIEIRRIDSKSISIYKVNSESSIDISDLANGVYNLSVVIDGKVYNKIFTKVTQY